MPIKSSGYFSDPAFAQAASNLASLFEPPSGADAAGWANANAKKAEAGRLAQFFDYQTSPEYDQATGDRMAVGAGVYTPNQSFYAVNQGDATMRRGQDVTANTSITNNAADNARSLEVGKIGSLADLYKPVAKDALRPEIPEDVAGRLGVNRALPAVQGNKSPMSETEFSAQQRARLLAEGQITDQDLIDTILGDQTPVQVVGPTGAPAFSTPGAAVRTGAEPFVNKGAEAKPSNAVALLSDNTQVPAVQGQDGRWLHAQTGEPLPAAIRIFDLPKATGSAADVGLGSTTANLTAATAREAAIRNGLARVKDYRKLLRENPAIAGIPGRLRGIAQDVVSFAGEISGAYGPEGLVFTSQEEVQDFAAQLGARGNFDPAIKAAQAMALEMAYLEAKALDPSGEVNVREMERFLDKWDGGLAGNNGVLASLDELERSLNTQLSTSVNTLRNPGQATAPPAPVAGGTRMQFDANGDPL